MLFELVIDYFTIFMTKEGDLSIVQAKGKHVSFNKKDIRKAKKKAKAKVKAKAASKKTEAVSIKKTKKKKKHKSKVALSSLIESHENEDVEY